MTSSNKAAQGFLQAFSLDIASLLRDLHLDEWLEFPVLNFSDFTIEITWNVLRSFLSSYHETLHYYITYCDMYCSERTAISGVGVS